MAVAKATASSETSSEPSTISIPDQQVQKAFSCVLCAQRKVRCDKKPAGCNNCAKARVPCIYKAPPPPRRRRKGVRDPDLATKLRIYEEALKKAGIDPESLLKDAMSGNGDVVDQLHVRDMAQARRTGTSSAEPAFDEHGILVAEHGKSRYLDTGIWTSLKSELGDLKQILDESSDEESSGDNGDIAPELFSSDGSRLLFGSPKASKRLRLLHPQPVEAFKLWQVYLDNINPLVKLFHAPTVQQTISEANGNLDGIPRNVEALLFAIYCVSVESLSDRECMAITRESKDVTRQRFRSGAQHALINASFLKTSDLMVLQALTLFIISLQNIDARIIWMLSGIAQRIGQRVGLHRDGDVLRLPPFEAEIRRRLWWQICILEGFSQKLAGTGTGASAQVLMGDVKLPANLNDSDLFPGMKELPQESDRATEMMFFLIRCHVGDFFKRFTSAQTVFDGVWSKLTTNTVDVSTKEKAIGELEHLFERKYLRHCDPSVVWHLMCTHLAKAIVFMMRFMSYAANYQGKTESQAKKDILFSLSLQVCSSQNLAYTMKEMQGFMWHVNMHFQWKAFVYVLSELRYRTSGPEVEQAWKSVQLTYEFHPTFDKGLSRRALPIAVTNLALQAWDAYIAANGMPSGGEPYFIQLLRRRQHSQRKSSTSPSISSKQTSTSTNSSAPSSTPNVVENAKTYEPMGVDHLAAFDWNASDLNASLGIPAVIPDLTPLNYPENMDWSTWDNLLVDFQTNDNTVYPPDISSFTFEV
ncbi:hypothetical protein N0V95_002409 [Ascochyta clinopodiicola]|nr:hypothetical protein N0V95_002409 [Ascochyta clinopodiicola]